MAQAMRPLSRPVGRASVGRRVADMAQHAWSRYWTRRVEHATVGLLHALDDRALRDIGLDRSEIESVVYNASRGERRICWAPIPVTQPAAQRAAQCGAPGCR
jgi:uncharacterized protein YjiS (DUF1127 family)